LLFNVLVLIIVFVYLSQQFNSFCFNIRAIKSNMKISLEDFQFDVLNKIETK
jgi:hypothetical protein